MKKKHARFNSGSIDILQNMVGCGVVLRILEVDKCCGLIFVFLLTAGYFLTTAFLAEVKLDLGEITFYDSNTGKALFQAPHGRSLDDFLTESRNYGWLSFRDDEVIWPNVKLMDNGEVVSIDGTHLGHNLPDMHGRRYCINMVSVAGRPKSDLVEV